MHKHLEKMNEITFDKIFNQRIGLWHLYIFLYGLTWILILGYLLFKDYCMNNVEESVPQLRFYEDVS